jgi:hypothetical protein
MKYLTVLAFIFSSFVALLSTAPTTATAQGLPLIREQNGFLATARLDSQNLKLRVLEYSVPYSGIVHAYLISKDLTNYYFEYPQETEKGSYVLSLPPMRAGVYDLILEITGGNGHVHNNPRFVQVYQFNFEVPTSDARLEPIGRLALKPTVPGFKGLTASFELTTLLDGEPVAWNPYYVHQFILKTDWSYFKHDHPNSKELGVGSVQSNFTFPSAGQYVLWQFLETGVRIAGQKYNPVLRYPSVFQVN